MLLKWTHIFFSTKIFVAINGKKTNAKKSGYGTNLVVLGHCVSLASICTFERFVRVVLDFVVY